MIGNAWSLSAAFLGGVGLWSFLEYVLHRFLGHDRRTMPNFFSVEHTRHHSEGNYFAPSWKKGTFAVLMAAGLVGLVALLASTPVALAFTAGFVGMYVTYELVHRRLHTHEGFGAYGRFLRRHHFHHHFGDPKKNHGVTSPVWDLVFGTLAPAGVITVPERLAMRWLLDPTTGEVRADAAGSYRLRRAA
jgi:sterol desaturase/sphingolipid hydroxylase (fatty acid hydroxylase superfamily)